MPPVGDGELTRAHGYGVVLDLAADGVPRRGDLPGTRLLQAGVLRLAPRSGLSAGGSPIFP